MTPNPPPGSFAAAWYHLAALAARTDAKGKE